MDKKRKLLLILLIFLVITLVILIKNNFNKYTLPNAKDAVDEDISEVEENHNKTKGKIQKVSNIGEYNLVKSCLQKFYIYYFENYDLKPVDELLYFFDENYLLRNDINMSNFKSKVKKLENRKNVEIYYLNYLTNYDNVNAYFVKGLLRNVSTNTSEEFEHIVYIDLINNSFSIDIENNLGKDFAMLKEGDEIELDIPKYVSAYENVFGKIKSTYESTAKILFENIQNIVIYNPEFAYSILENKDDFGNFEEFKNFIDNNKKQILLMYFSVYEIKNENGLLKFICYDKDANFCVTILMDEFSSYKYILKKI